MSSDANPSREFYERALAQVPAVICDHEPTCSQPIAEVAPPCTRCGHNPTDHDVREGAVIQDPHDERARFHCTVEGCECPNYEWWTRP